jgi:hypothetical protein
LYNVGSAITNAEDKFGAYADLIEAIQD